MKQLFYLFILNSILPGCNSTNTSGNNIETSKGTDSMANQEVDKQELSIQPQSIFTRADAAKILGEPASISDSAVSDNEGIWMYKCTYTAKNKDKTSGKTGNIYFMVEQYDKLELAKKVYSDIKKANESHEGIQVLDDLGDEAYYHSDGTNFYFILARKGPRVLRMKVNKITSKTSRDGFNQVARQVVDAL